MSGCGVDGDNPVKRCTVLTLQLYLALPHLHALFRIEQDRWSNSLLPFFAAAFLSAVDEALRKDDWVPANLRTVVRLRLQHNQDQLSQAQRDLLQQLFWDIPGPLPWLASYILYYDDTWALAGPSGEAHLMWGMKQSFRCPPLLK